MMEFYPVQLVTECVESKMREELYGKVGRGEEDPERFYVDCWQGLRGSKINV